MQPIDIDIAGRNAETFPGLQIWGWEIALYLFLGGLTAGLLILSGLAHRKTMGGAGHGLGRAKGWLGPVLAPVVLSLGMGALFLDLEHKLHMWRFYTTFQATSPMSWGAWILALVYPASLVFAWAGWSEFGPAGKPLVTGLEFPFRRLLGTVNVVLGVALGVYTGILLGAFGARPLWNSPVLGPLFLASGLSGAAALLMLLEPDAELKHGLSKLDGRLLGVEALVLGLYFLALATGGQAQREAAGLFFGGAYTAVFWIGVMFLGMVVPLLLEKWQQAGRAQVTVIPQVLVLLGGAALRAVLVLAGQASRWEVSL